MARERGLDHCLVRVFIGEDGKGNRAGSHVLDVVPGAGFEPARPLGQEILSLVRLPFRHPGAPRRPPHDTQATAAAVSAALRASSQPSSAASKALTRGAAAQAAAASSVARRVRRASTSRVVAASSALAP